MAERSHAQRAPGEGQGGVVEGGRGGRAGQTGPSPPPTSWGRENLLNFIIWYMYSAGDRVSRLGSQSCASPPSGAPPSSLPTPWGLTVMAPGHEDVLQAAVGLVHAELRAAGTDRG